MQLLQDRRSTHSVSCKGKLIATSSSSSHCHIFIIIVVVVLFAIVDVVLLQLCCCCCSVIAACRNIAEFTANVALWLSMLLLC